eukprot:scaffold23658_cov61-Phaeocystis_antarctica.AAC.12
MTSVTEVMFARPTAWAVGAARGVVEGSPCVVVAAPCAEAARRASCPPPAGSRSGAAYASRSRSAGPAGGTHTH